MSDQPLEQSSKLHVIIDTWDAFPATDTLRELDDVVSGIIETAVQKATEKYEQRINRLERQISRLKIQVDYLENGESRE